MSTLDALATIAKANGRASVKILKIPLRLSAPVTIGPHVLVTYERDHGDGYAHENKTRFFLDDFPDKYSRPELIARLSACRTLEDLRAFSYVNPSISVLF